MKSQSDIAALRLPKRLAAIVLDTLDDQATYEDALIAEAELSDQAAEFVTFESTHFKQVALQRAQLLMLRLADVRLESCDLAEAICEKLSVSRAELLGCRLIGLQANDGRLEDLLVKGCNAAHAQFWGC